MTSATIQKYSKKSVAQLLVIAKRHFNLFIRNRDKDRGCVSCKGKVAQAGHFYSAGHHDRLRFNEHNTHGQCIRCNHFLSGNLNEYRKNLPTRITADQLAQLDLLAGIKGKFQWGRYTLIEIIEKYKELNKINQPIK